MQELTFLALAFLALMYYSKRSYALELENKLKRVEDIEQYTVECRKKVTEYAEKKQHEIEIEKEKLEKQQNELEEQRRNFESHFNTQEKILEGKKNYVQKVIDQKKNELDIHCKGQFLKLELEKERHQQRLEEQQDDYNKKKLELKEERSLIDTIITSKISTFPVIASMIADYTARRDEYIAKTIEKIRPRAFRAKEEVNKLKEEKRKLLAENLEYKWEIQNLHSLLPWIDDIKDDFIVPQSDGHINQTYNGKDDDAKYWLTNEEYNNLSETEKYQLALDRYLKRHKTNAEIGREYERYIGYLYAKKGFTVTYFGIEKGLEDLGRDLICEKDGKIHIVQCKCWSEKKEIHEKHINQLFGTTVMYYMTAINTSGSVADFYSYLSSKRLIPVFASTTNYSTQAKNFAYSLGVVLKKVKLEPYPVIKCNISKKGEKIYHLPFDQQYDKVKIDKTGECLVTTVAEAEEKGFRRAMRWFG